MRIRRSSWQRLENEPDWMQQLRQKFENRFEELLNISKDTD